MNVNQLVPFIGVEKETGLRVSGGRMREHARVDDWPLQPRDGRRETPDKQRIANRHSDGADASRRAIAQAQQRRPRCEAVDSKKPRIAAAVCCSAWFGPGAMFTRTSTTPRSGEIACPAARWPPPPEMDSCGLPSELKSDRRRHVFRKQRFNNCR